MGQPEDVRSLTPDSRPVPALLSMRWLDLLFAHWPIAPDALRPLIPTDLELDTFGGSAWLGIVPFRMTHVRPLRFPLRGEAFAFAETNVRTYVTAPDGTPGIWFLSLDGADLAGATAARLAFGVPYHHARVSSSSDGRWIAHASRCVHDGPAELRLRYRPTGEVAFAAPGSLEAFLTHRLSLFARLRGRITETRVSHAPWPLQPAEAVIERNTMAESFGIVLPSEPPILQFSGRLDTVAHRPRLVDA